MIRNSLFLLLVIGFIACNKQANNDTYKLLPADTGALFNNRAYPLQVDLYETKADRLNEVNKVYSCAVPSVGSCRFPLAKVNPAVMYQYDIYTSDYKYSNWPWGVSGTAINGYGNTHTFDLGNYSLAQARYYFLRGNNKKTTWKAIDRMYDNVSDWHTLSDSSKFMLLEIYEDASVTVNYFPSWFVPVPYMHDTLTAQMVTEPDYYAILSLTNGGGYSYIYSTPHKPQYNVPGSNSIDTLTFSYMGREWIMVRE